MERWALELIIVIISFGTFISYHVYLFSVHDKLHPGAIHNAWRLGKKARAIACDAWTRGDEKDVVNGIQAIRNAMTSVTFMSALTGILATLIVPIMLDPVKTVRIEQLALSDPILRTATGKPLVPPVAVLGCSVGVLWASFSFFAQSVRLFVHLGFLLRAVPSVLNHDRSGRRIFSEMDARRVAVKAGMAFTIGLRLWYLFLPTICWAFGVTALLISSVFVTALVASFDRYEVRPERPEDELDDDECAHGALLEDLAPPLPQQQHQQRTASAAQGAATMGDGADGGTRVAAGEASLSAGVAPGRAAAAAGAAGAAAGGGDVELGTAAGPTTTATSAAPAAGAPMVRLQPAIALTPTPAPTPATSAATTAGAGAAATAAPPSRASSLAMADLSRLSSGYSALSWNRCPGHSHRRQSG